MARRLRWLALGGTLLAPSLLILALLGGAGGGLLVSLSGAEDLPHRWAALIAALLTVLVIAALLALAGMLACVERGELFAPEATRYFRRFAQLMLLAVVATLLLPPFAQVTAAALEGRGEVAVTIEGGDLLWLFLTLVFDFVARLFEQAAHYEADSQSIV